MSLAYGRPTRAIPGPSIIPDRVLNAMHRPAPNIYEGELVAVTETVAQDLKTVAGTRHHLAMYIGNGHAAWEAALANTVAPGDKVLVLVSGRFGLGWGEIARALGAEVEFLDGGTTAALDPDRLEARLRADTAHEITSVLTVQTDTASSINNDIPALAQAIRAAGHPALFQVDCIACLACEPFEMDAWGVDVMVAGCQKGLMTPPGMGFTFANPRAFEKRQSLSRVSPYFDWVPRFHPQMYYQNFFGTAPTHHIFGLREALDMLLKEEGLANVLNRHRVLAEAVWAAAEVWGETGMVAANVPQRIHRSVAVTCLRSGPGDDVRLRRWAEEEAGLTLGIGLGMEAKSGVHAEGMFRIGHMGHLNPPMILGTLATIEAGMSALGITHGGGALRAASDVIAGALLDQATAGAA
ncbi:MAG: aminotransferase class V-fold PLP-dependent enzyme [Pseudomonadota bacterium]